MEPKGDLYNEERRLEHFKQFESKRIAEDNANRLMSFVNHYGCDYAAFAKTVAGGHKTLQQSVMRLFIATIREMAKVTPDDRNAQSVELAKEILKIADGYSLPLI